MFPKVRIAFIWTRKKSAQGVYRQHTTEDIKSPEVALLWFLTPHITLLFVHSKCQNMHVMLLIVDAFSVPGSGVPTEKCSSLFHLQGHKFFKALSKNADPSIRAV